MTINKSEVDGNSAAGTGLGASGGGIINANTGAPNSGVLTVNNSELNNNSAGGVGGGLVNGIPNFPPHGPALPPGQVTLNHSKVTNNTATLGGGGIANVDGTVTLSSTSVTGNDPNDCQPDWQRSGLHRITLRSRFLRDQRSPAR